MRRREFAKLVAATALWPTVANAQKPMPVIGFLSSRAPSESALHVAAFLKGLSEAGYVVAQNVVIEYRWAEGQYDRLPTLAVALVEHKVDVIASFGGSPAALAAKTASSTIPIVFHVGGDPVDEGLIASLARPGGNLTGVSFLALELDPKRLELLLEMVPHARIVALLVNPNFPQSERTKRGMRQAAIAKGIQLYVLEADTDARIDAAFMMLSELHAAALVVGGDPYLTGRQEQILALATNASVPAIYQWPEFAAAGGLISYGPSLTASYQQVGSYVGKILKGAKPADLPVQQPTKFELVINFRTATALGLTVPQSLLAGADEVIE